MDVLIPIGIAVFLALFMMGLVLNGRRRSFSRRMSMAEFLLFNQETPDNSSPSGSASPSHHHQSGTDAGSHHTHHSHHHHHHDAAQQMPSVPDVGAQHHFGGFDG